MKKINKRKLIISVTTFLLVSVVLAQKSKQPAYPDTLLIETEAKIDLKIAFYRASSGDSYMTDQLWNSILSVMETAAQSSDYDGGVIVSYRNVEHFGEEAAKVQIIPIEENSDVFLIGKDEMKEYRSDRYEFELYQPKVAISFTLNDLDDLDLIKKVSVEAIWKGINQKQEEIDFRRTTYDIFGELKFGQLKVKKIDKGTPKDFIEFSAGVGLGYYADRFVPDISYDVSFRFQDRFGKPSTKFGLLYTQHYFVSRGEENDLNIDLNGFLSGYFAINTSTEKEYGVGFGYLINQNGDFYKGHTYKMTIYNRRSSKTNLTPELIFTDGFKKAFPALRFGLTF
ncbi:hypothetical protein AAOE16_11650 [Ekhidna sp. MALMAid0563]|uniref:hypothetical protein n=1 Tax=Ekhidna sp. MALMAid0563 TaxID=3143937 RepID=UPI0032DFF39A